MLAAFIIIIALVAMHYFMLVVGLLEKRSKHEWTQVRQHF
jgi:hypothetical protein